MLGIATLNPAYVIFPIPGANLVPVPSLREAVRYAGQVREPNTPTRVLFPSVQFPEAFEVVRELLLDLAALRDQ